MSRLPPVTCLFTGKKTPGEPGHTGAQGHTDHTDEPHNHPTIQKHQHTTLNPQARPTQQPRFRGRPLPAVDSEEAAPGEPDPAASRSQSTSPCLLVYRYSTVPYSV